MKRQIESLKIEYEAKMCELNEDLIFLKNQLNQNDKKNTIRNSIINDLKIESDHLEIINDLNEKLAKLNSEHKSNELKIVQANQKCHHLEETLMENSQQLASFKLEVFFFY